MEIVSRSDFSGNWTSLRMIKILQLCNVCVWESKWRCLPIYLGFKSDSDKSFYIMKRQFFIFAIFLFILTLSIKFFWASTHHRSHNVDFNTEHLFHSIDNFTSIRADLVSRVKENTSNNSNLVPFTTTSISSIYGINVQTFLSHSTNTNVPREPNKNVFTDISSDPAKIDWRRYQSLTSNIRLIRNRSNCHVVETPLNASFLERIDKFCKAINRERQKILSGRGLQPWQDVQEPNKLKVLWGRDDDFLGKLVSEKNLRFVLLPWRKSKRNSANVVVNNYYQWTASDPLCDWIRTPRFTKAHFDAVYNRSCEGNLKSSRNPKILEPMYFHSKPINQLHYWPEDGLQYPSNFYSRYPTIPLYLSIIQDGIVNMVGDVISGSLKIVPFTCSHDSIPTIPREYPDSPIYKEVFVVTQFWGESFFHRMIEVMPRLAPFLSFLRSNPSIKIHAPRDRGMTYEMMKLFDLNPERIVVGIIRAKIIYLPQGTPCGFPQVQSLQLLSHHFRNSLKDNRSFQNNSVVSFSPRNKLIMIRRSGTRRFLHDQEMEVLLKNFSEKHGLILHIFSDNAIPGLVETISLFNSAFIVVAPHGAGLSNVLFSEPGTLVVEGVCNPPHVNMCFQFVSHVLGHRYHAIPSISGCESYINIVPQDFIDILDQFYTFNILE